MDIKSYLKSASVPELEDIRSFVDEELKTRKASPSSMKKVVVYTDGAARGNPGPAGIGVIVFDGADEKITQDYRFIGETTNNEAEYRALLLALDLAYDLTDDQVECFSDSQLMVRQLNGEYALKSEKLAQFFDEVKKRAGRFRSIKFNHVLREHPKIQLADKLANKAIDEARPRKAGPASIHKAEDK